MVVHGSGQHQRLRILKYTNKTEITKILKIGQLQIAILTNNYANFPTGNWQFLNAVFACILVVYFYNVIFYMVIIHLAIDTFRCLSPPCKG